MSVARPPVVGIMCGNEAAGRPVQAVASRFVTPLARLCGASVLLVPAVREAASSASLAGVLDGLLLTGGHSHVSPQRYGGGDRADADPVDPERDAVAFVLAERMIEAGKPVYGICRGMQEINVLFGGSLAGVADGPRHHRGSWDGDHAELFGHRHSVTLADGGALAAAAGRQRLDVNSAHQQGVDRLGGGLRVEATACGDGLVEAISAVGCGADVLAVQWHPEWDTARCAASRAFFALLAASLRPAAVR